MVVMRFIGSILVAAVLLTACTAGTTTPQMGADGKPLHKLYRISNHATNKIQFRILDSVNSLRQAAGTSEVAMNAQLIAAAETHSRDMSAQNRPWHFGSDGSSPIDRVLRLGYSGPLLGELISETYETELETLGAWMEKPDTRAILLDKRATNMGFAWYQESTGKIWWTLIMGG